MDGCRVAVLCCSTSNHLLGGNLPGCTCSLCRPAAARAMCKAPCRMVGPARPCLATRIRVSRGCYCLFVWCAKKKHCKQGCGAGQVSSFGSLPRSMSTAVLADGSPDGHRAPEAYMSKVESIASTAVRAATKMDVSSPGLASCCCALLLACAECA